MHKRAILGCLILSLTSGFAQSSEDAAAEDIITLSPFEVSTDVDSGYRARAVLSGARMMNQLVDPATAMARSGCI